MEYVETHTKIPIPHLYSYNPRFDSAVGYPYLAMSKAHGVPLISLWGDMSDEHWREILREVVNILVELWSHRFDKAGVLFKREDIIGQGKVGWVVEAELVIGDLADVHVRHNLKSTSHPSAASYWMAYANALLVDIEANNFGAFLKNMGYARTWLLRSFIIALFDSAEDAEGYPLCHGDINEQNTMVNNTGVSPHITAIIDWEISGLTYVYGPAQYTLLIIDHPSLTNSEEDKRKRARNTKDQAVFDELILQAEAKSSSSHMGCSSPVSILIAGSLGSYLFQQIAQFPHVDGVKTPLLVAHIFGPGDDDEYPMDLRHQSALIESGILKGQSKRFAEERRVFLEAREILGETEACHGLTAAQFRILINKNLHRFGPDSITIAWLVNGEK